MDQAYLPLEEQWVRIRAGVGNELRSVGPNIPYLFPHGKSSRSRLPSPSYEDTRMIYSFLVIALEEGREEGNRIRRELNMKLWLCEHCDVLSFPHLACNLLSIASCDQFARAPAAWIW